QQPAGQTSYQGPSGLSAGREPGTVTDAPPVVVPSVRASRSSTRSTSPVTNAGCTPGVGTRSASSPASRAVVTASSSRSHSTSMWSDTNPTGMTTTALVPCAASSTIASLTSGSSHGVVGAPLRDWYTSDHGTSANRAARPPVPTSLAVPTLAMTTSATGRRCAP